ncbi:hypothetical protein M0802_013608 [Mischocyttarus mexicanus]|nr:hypothetical protein M0802_013608 [Mischocyttarus mexicanus]
MIECWEIYGVISPDTSLLFRRCRFLFRILESVLGQSGHSPPKKPTNAITDLPDPAEEDRFHALSKETRPGVRFGGQLRRGDPSDNYWSQVARQENYRRGIVSNILYNENISVIFSVNWKKEYFKYLLKMSSFNVFVVSANYEGPPISSCYCNYQKPSYCSLIFQIYFSYNLMLFAESVSFPDSHKIQLNTFTFQKLRGEEFVYCPELRTMSGPDFQLPLEMRPMISRYFDKNKPMKTCMILISDLSSANIAKNILEDLKEWFPQSEISVWSGIIVNILTCKNLTCKSTTDIILIFISNRDLKTWVTTWPAKNDTREIFVARLLEFKQRIEFKKHSLALIYKTGHFFPDDPDLKTEFQKVFVKIPCIFFHGPALLAAENIQGV